MSLVKCLVECHGNSGKFVEFASDSATSTNQENLATARVKSSQVETSHGEIDPSSSYREFSAQPSVHLLRGLEQGQGPVDL